MKDISRETEFDIPYNAKTLKFVYPVAAPGNFDNVGLELISRKQRILSGDETASLIHAVYCIPDIQNKPESNEIRNIFENCGFWLFERPIWTEKGVYINQDFSTDAWKASFDLKTLSDRVRAGKTIDKVMFSLDEKLRFASKTSYKFGEQSVEDLRNNGYVIASCGVDGARKLAEVAKKFRLNPYVDGSETNDFELGLATISVLNGDRLVLGGRSFVGFGESSAVGLR